MAMNATTMHLVHFKMAIYCLSMDVVSVAVDNTNIVMRRGCYHGHESCGLGHGGCHPRYSMFNLFNLVYPKALYVQYDMIRLYNVDALI